MLIYKKRIDGAYEGMNDFIIMRRIVSLLSTSLAIARVKISTVRTILILALLVELMAGTASGAAFRLSFLDQEQVLADTCQLLRQNGFSEDSVATFKKLVEHHNQNGNRVDRTKFPAPQAGYYEFRDLADFTNRLQTLLYLTRAKIRRIRIRSCVSTWPVFYCVVRVVKPPILRKTSSRRA